MSLSTTRSVQFQFSRGNNAEEDQTKILILIVALFNDAVSVAEVQNLRCPVRRTEVCM